MMAYLPKPCCVTVVSELSYVWDPNVRSKLARTGMIGSYDSVVATTNTDSVPPRRICVGRRFTYSLQMLFATSPRPLKGIPALKC